MFQHNNSTIIIFLSGSIIKPEKEKSRGLWITLNKSYNIMERLEAIYSSFIVFMWTFWKSNIVSLSWQQIDRELELWRVTSTAMRGELHPKDCGIHLLDDPTGMRLRTTGLFQLTDLVEGMLIHSWPCLDSVGDAYTGDQAGDDTEIFPEFWGVG